MSNLKENQTQAKAFIHYFEQGDDRKIEETATAFGKSKKTIYKWSNMYRWKERIALKNQELNERMEKEHMDLIVSMNADFLHLINKSLGVFALNMQKGEVEVKTVRDLKDLYETFKKLSGEGDKVEVNSTVTTTNVPITDEDRESMNNIANAILSLKKSKEEEEEED